jgi:hypothetical protein
LREGENNLGEKKLLCICDGYPSPTSLLNDFKLFFKGNKIDEIYGKKGILRLINFKFWLSMVFWVIFTLLLIFLILFIYIKNLD